MDTKLGMWWAVVRGPAGRRWLHWLLTVAAVTAVGAILLPSLRRNPAGIHSYFAAQPAWQRVLALFVASCSVVWPLFELLSPKSAHLRLAVFRRHPPMWSAWIVAVVILCVIDLTTGLGPSNFQPKAWQWVLYGGGSLIFVVVFGRLSRVPEQPTPVPSVSGATSVEELVRDWPTLERWLRSEQPAEDDLIGNRRIARRLAQYLAEHGGTIGLVGPFGSGKTSVVSWLKDEVNRVRKPGQTQLWFADQSCWGFEDSGAAVQQVLARATEAVGLRADCFSFRSLPEAYRKTFSAGGDWLRTLADMILGSTDPFDQFRQLSDVLESVDARLVLVIEDLDRTTSRRFDRQEVLALLQRLRTSSARVSFVLATGQTSARDIDFAKLCDHIEILQDFDAARVSTLITAVRSHSLEEFPHIATADDSNPWGRSQYLSVAQLDIVGLSDAAARLLRTPRALKHALRRTYQSWQVLYGEVDFDHLLAVNILRSGAPEAFDFLIRHWTELHDDPTTWRSGRDQVERIRQRLTEEWRRVTKDVEWDVRAAMTILVYLLPPAGEFLAKKRGVAARRLQGIGNYRHWLRIVNEEIAPGQVLDQIVLKDVADWRKSPRTASPLVEGLCKSGRYVDIWEYFAPSFFGSNPKSILGLAEQFLSCLHTPHGARRPTTSDVADSTAFGPPDAAFAAIWRYTHNRISDKQTAREWLERQVQLAMPSSLALVNDLYYYWASAEHGIVDSEGRAYIRGVIRELARKHLRSGEDLLRTSHPEIVYGVYSLVFPDDTNAEPSKLRGLPDWDWVAPIVLDALRMNPVRLAQEVGSLISNGRHGERPGVWIYEIDYNLLNGFFGSAANEVIDLLASARESFSGHRHEVLDQLVRSAAIPEEPAA